MLELPNQNVVPNHVRLVVHALHGGRNEFDLCAIQTDVLLVLLADLRQQQMKQARRQNNETNEPRYKETHHGRKQQANIRRVAKIFVALGGRGRLADPT